MNSSSFIGSQSREVASTSGRVVESALTRRSMPGKSVENFQLYLGKGRAVLSGKSLRCEALALPSGVNRPLLKVLQQFAKRYQERHAETSVFDFAPVDTQQQPKAGQYLAGMLKQATLAAVQAGLRLTGMAILLARTFIHQTVRMVRTQHKLQGEAEEARLLLKKQAIHQYVKQRETLRLHGKDTAFMKMLQSLDRCHLDHEVKWALVQKHTADKADFSKRLQQLFDAATLSKAAVETMLRPDASRAEINQFWKSSQTAELIAEEESLKSLVFAQMLQV